MMRKLIVLSFISLDGVMQAPGGPDEDPSGGFAYGGWTVPYFDDEAGKVMDVQMHRPFDLLLGRKTFEIFSGYWPRHNDIWPEANTATKYVVSTTLNEPMWKPAMVLRDAEEIRKVKANDGPELQVHGSGNLIQTLLKHDLVDELWLKIFPITLGTGKRLFTDGSIPAAFKLTKSTVTPSGVIVANYERAGEVKTGSFVDEES